MKKKKVRKVKKGKKSATERVKPARRHAPFKLPPIKTDDDIASAIRAVEAALKHHQLTGGFNIIMAIRNLQADIYRHFRGNDLVIAMKVLFENCNSIEQDMIRQMIQ